MKHFDTRRTSKSDVVTAAIRELVISGQLAASTPLKQRDLALKFGVSPTPVREALRRLESEGLIHYDSHKGATVIATPLGPSEENFEIRAALEGLAARLAAERMAEQKLAELEALNTEMAGCGDGDHEASEINRRFHFSIYVASRSPSLLALLRLLWQSFPDGFYAHVGRSVAESVAQHASIITALRERDGARAQALTHVHVLGAIQPSSALLRPTSISADPKATTEGQR
jgi:DNA-binding GntR family transcriptional regulator